MLKRMFGLVLAVLLMAIVVGGGAATSPDNDLDPHEYLSSQGFKRLWGDTHSHAHTEVGVVDGKPTPLDDDGWMNFRKLYKEGTEQQDFLIHTGHAEQGRPGAVQKFQEAANRTGKLIGIASEWTGSTETGKYNPGYSKSQGHVLIYGSSTRIGQMSLRGGVPDEIVPLFGDLLGRLPEVRDTPIGVFAHPALYKVEETFDLDGVAPGYDPPPSAEALVTMKGCELTSHGPPATGATVGLGDGIHLASSNEACFRRLLRGGWQLSPYMGTDNHLPHYPRGPWTCLWVRERSLDAIYDAMEERLTCGTEASGVSIAFIGQLQRGLDHPAGPKTVMGQKFLIPDPRRVASWVHLRATVRDREGQPLKGQRLQQMKYVFVCKEPEHDQVDVLERVRPHVPDHNPDENTLIWKPHAPYPGMAPRPGSPGDVVAIYAVANLGSGVSRKQLISAPLFIEHRGP